MCIFDGTLTGRHAALKWSMQEAIKFLNSGQPDAARAQLEHALHQNDDDEREQAARAFGIAPGMNAMEMVFGCDATGKLLPTFIRRPR